MRQKTEPAIAAVLGTLGHAVTEPRLARIPGVSLSSLSGPLGPNHTKETHVRYEHDIHAGTRGISRAFALLQNPALTR